MTSFTTTFGNSAISPADVAYAAYTFGSNLTLFWPQFAAGQTNVAARFMNLTATTVSLNVSMPDATLVSVGYDVLIVNVGTNTFNLVGFAGGAIATIAAGQAFYVNLNSNTTQAGVWQVVQFGVGTSAAVAAALAGPGLLASGGLLEQNILGTILSGSIALTSTARAVLQIWNGGAGTVTLPSAASVGNGFFFPFANDGTSSVTIATVGGDQIDGASTSVFSQTQSAFIVSTGTAWFTVGKGLQNNFSVTVLNLNVAGSADVTETSAQAQSIIQQYTGVLTGSINVIVPATPQIYFAFNNTTGPYTLTVKTAAGTGVQVAQGTNTILYCDGTNVVGAFTSSVGSSISLPVGSVGAPTLNFVGSTTTGLYSPTTNQMAVTAGGYEVMNFVSNPNSVNFLQSSASSTGQAVSISALGSDTNITFNLVPKGSGALNIGTSSFSAGAISGMAITGSSITATGTVQGATLVGTASITTAGTISALSTITGSSITATGTVQGATLVGTASITTAGTISALSTIKGTALIPTGSSITANGIYLPVANTVGISANSGDVMRFATSGTGNFFSILARGSGSTPSISSAGVDTNVGMIFATKGASNIDFQTSGAEQFRILNTNSAANFLNVAAATAGSFPSISASGSDSNIGITLTPKGTEYGYSPTPPAADNSTRIATTAFVQGAAIMTPLGVGSIILARHDGGNISAGATVAAASLTPVYLQLGTSGGAVSNGDSISGTWQCLSSIVAASTNATIWQRTV